MTFSKPMDIGSYRSLQTSISITQHRPVRDHNRFLERRPDHDFPGADQPAASRRQYELYSYYMTDLSGNPQQNFAINFTAAFTANTTPPTVINTSPENAETLVPVNAPVQILFSEPIQPTSIGSITVNTGGSPIAVTPTFSDGNQLLTLTPTLPLLAANAGYTITITGVKDTAGNVMSGTVTNTFTTGPTFNLIHPSVTVADPPTNSIGVGTNVAPQVVFSERLNPLSVVTSSNELYNNGSVELYNNATSQFVPVTVSYVGRSADGDHHAQFGAQRRIPSMKFMWDAPRATTTLPGTTATATALTSPQAVARIPPIPRSLPSIQPTRRRAFP